MKILITGASTGIGAQTARTLANGNELFLVYNRSAEPAQKLAEELTAAGTTVHLFQADITSEEACTKLFADLAATTDYLDVLVNNAGGLIRRQAAPELEWNLMEEIYKLNVFSLLKISSLAIPFLKKGQEVGAQNSSIINLTSIAMRHGAPGATIYGSAKGAVDTFTRGLCKELAPHIRVNSVSPGVIETPFHDKVSTPDQLAAWAQGNPLQRNGKAEHIASAIKLLVENDFINGESIDVNGGLMMR